MITAPRAVYLTLGALFSVYHVLLATFSYTDRGSSWTDAIAIGLYAAVSVPSLWPRGDRRLPLWLALADLAVAAALPLLVTARLDAGEQNGYGTWYVAAVGTLMTVVCARDHAIIAWLGIGFLTVHTLVWAGPAALPALGVVGSIAWVGITTLMVRELARAGREVHALSSAERAAAAWRAAEEAHLYERTARLGQTRSMAVSMLRRIVESGGELSEDEKRECRYLEAAVRDEIRGRRLLNDAVRSRIISARRRGTVVSVLDDGGLDHTDGDELAVILDDLARVLTDADAQRLVVRTGPSDSGTAVTVVGLTSSGDGSAGALGHDLDEEDEVAVWIEIPRRSN